MPIKKDSKTSTTTASKDPAQVSANQPTATSLRNICGSSGSKELKAPTKGKTSPKTEQPTASSLANSPDSSGSVQELPEGLSYIAPLPKRQTPQIKQTTKIARNANSSYQYLCSCESNSLSCLRSALKRDTAIIAFFALSVLLLFRNGQLLTEKMFVILRLASLALLIVTWTKVIFQMVLLSRVSYTFPSDYAKQVSLSKLMASVVQTRSCALFVWNAFYLGLAITCLLKALQSKFKKKELLLIWAIASSVMFTITLWMTLSGRVLREVVKDVSIGKSFTCYSGSKGNEGPVRNRPEPEVVVLNSKRFTTWDREKKKKKSEGIKSPVA